jgi:AbrB family looped-hinge helix DNA binding protein
MATQEITKIGKRGTLVIPVALRRRFALEDGSPVVIEERKDGLSVRPVVAMPVEIYSPERKAEFILSNAIDARDYRRALKEVRKMGLDPRKIDHMKPPGV